MTVEQKRVAEIAYECVRTLKHCKASSPGDCEICKKLFDLGKPPCWLKGSPDTLARMRSKMLFEQTELP